MVKKGKTARLKRKPAPKNWPSHRKEKLFILKPSPGAHAMDKCLPLTLVLRDMMDFAKNRREAQLIVSQGKILVDGRVLNRDDVPLGLMDVVAMPDSKKYFRIVPSHKGLFLNPVNKEETDFKLCRIEDKSTVKGGIQINLHDGTNLLVKVEDPKNPIEDKFKTFDVLKLSLPDKEVMECLELKEGNMAFITGGKNIGVLGKIVDIEKAEAKKKRLALVVVEDKAGNRFQTILDFVFSIGQATPMIATPEATAVV